MTILRLIFAMALFYVAVAENIRGAAKPKLDLGDVQQGDILNAMERFTRALSKGASGLQLPDNFKKADGSFISIPHTMEVISEAEAKRKLATPVAAPTKCDGDGASEIQTITVNSMDMSFNYMTNPAFTPMPTDVAGFTTLADSILTAVTGGTTALCMFLNVDVGQQGLNWDTATNAVIQADIDLSDAAIFEATCTNCYAEMGGAITYKATCTLGLTPADSACNVQMFVGGGVKFGLDMSITKLNLDASTVDKQLITGTKQKVFYDPQTSITISVTPALSVSFEGSAVSTGSLRVQTSMDSQVSVGLTFVAPAATFDVGFAGDITLVPPTITSTLEMDTYDLTVSVVPNLLWTIGAGQMVTAPVLSAIPDDNVAATGMAVEVNIPNPMSFNWEFTKTASDVTSKATATVGFAVSTMNAYLAANWYYTGSTATMDKRAPLYDYSQWPFPSAGVGVGNAEYNWPIYTSTAAATTAPLGADVPGAVSLTTPSTPPAPGPGPGPAPAPGGNTSSSGDAKTGMSGGEVAALVIGLLVAIALGYYGYNHYLSKAAQDDAYTGLNGGLDTKINA